MNPGPVSYGMRLSLLADADPAGVAFTFVTDNGVEHTVTWRELNSRSNRIARSLTALGIGQGDMVVIELPNSIAHVVMAFGAWKVGACTLPLRWDLPDWERCRVLHVAAPAIVVSMRDDATTPARLERPEFSDAAVPDCIPNPARAIASSGSTGTPKVICAKGSGTFELAGIENSPVKALGQHPGQVQLIPAPLYHTNGSVLTYTALLQGQSLVLMERFSADLALALIERHQVNTFTATTIMLQRMARSPGMATRKLDSVESVLHGAAPLPRWLARFWIDRIGAERFFCAYGSSENAGVCFIRGDEWLKRPGSVGRPVDTEMRIRDDAGRDVARGEVGMIHARRPGQTEPVFTYLGDGLAATGSDGFTALGDLGWMDDDGYLYMADRRIDMIVTGGANVYPAEVESALTEHPDVADAAVIGLPDDEWGQRVHAVVVLTEGADDPDVADTLRDFCRTRLAAYKVPKAVEIVAGLPRSDAGKIRRSDLIAERQDVPGRDISG